MRQIRNRTHRPLRIPLDQGKVLHLAPGATAQISDPSVERPAFRKMVEEGAVEVLGEGHPEGDAPEPHVPSESTHGHAQPRVVMPSGNRSGESRGRR